MSDFPRGWTLTVDLVGAASITVPAIPGVSHVLDAFFAQLGTNAGGGALQVQLSSSDGTFNNMVIGHPILPAAAAGSFESASASGSDLGLAAGPGASLTVFMGAIAGVTETLVIQGHDI
jgi:hypothetical protein